MTNTSYKNESLEAIEATLSQFTGTTRYHRYSPLFRSFVLTDGVQYLAEKCGAYWLLDVIASYQNNPKITKHPMLKGNIQFWKLEVNDSKGVVKCEWDEGQTVLTQDISYTDFPLSSVGVWVAPSVLGNNEKVQVAMLPSEY